MATIRVPDRNSDNYSIDFKSSNFMMSFILTIICKADYPFRLVSFWQLYAPSDSFHTGQDVDFTLQNNHVIVRTQVRSAYRLHAYSIKEYEQIGATLAGSQTRCDLVFDMG